MKEWFLYKKRAKFDLRSPFSCYNSASQTIFIFFRCLEGVNICDFLMPQGRTPNFLILSPQMDMINLSAIKSWHYCHFISGKVAIDTWVSCAFAWLHSAWKDLVTTRRKATELHNFKIHESFSALQTSRSILYPWSIPTNLFLVIASLSIIVMSLKRKANLP